MLELLHEPLAEGIQHGQGLGQTPLLALVGREVFLASLALDVVDALYQTHGRGRTRAITVERFLEVATRMCPACQWDHTITRLVAMIGQIVIGLQISREVVEHLAAVLLPSSFAVVEEYRLQQRGVISPEVSLVCGSLPGSVLHGQACFIDLQIAGPTYDILLRFQLKNGDYRQAAATADLIDAQKTLKRQSADLIVKLKLGMVYVRVLSHDTSITIRNVRSNSKQPLDVLMLYALVYRHHSRIPETIKSLESMKNHIDRTRELRRDRPLWLLSRMVSIYARNELSLRNCVLDRRFVRYQREFANYTIVTAVQGVVSPLQWWKVFVS